MRRVLAAGASGVLMGTRFVATREGNAHDEYKNALTRAKASDAVMTVLLSGRLDQRSAPRAAQPDPRDVGGGRMPARPAKRPGEGDVIATNTAIGAKRIRYSLAPPNRTTA